MTLRKAIYIVLLVCSSLVLVVASACAPAAPAATPAAKATPKPGATAPTEAAKPTPRAVERIKVQIPVKASQYLPLFMGKAKGIFAEEGLDPEIIVLKGDLAVPALLKGDVDYLNVVGRTLQAAMLGEPVRVVMGQETRAGWHYILGPGITSPQQLKGKAVAIAMKGGTDHYASVTALQHLGLDPDRDVTFVVIASYSDMLAALKSRSVAGAGLIPPESNRAVAEGMKDALWVGDILELPSGGLGTSVKKIQESPQQVKSIIRAYLRSMAYARDHKDEAIEYVVKEFEVTRDIAEAVVTDELKSWAYDGIISDEGLKNQIGAWTLGGGPQKDATLQQVKQAIDNTLLKEALKEPGLFR